MSERSNGSRQSLRGLTLAVLIPCLLFSATLAGWATYRDLYDVILNDGFEQKLEAVSTGVAAFIDGSRHVALGRPTRVTAMAGDPRKPVLWALDPDRGQLVTVDMVTGGAEPVGALPVDDPAGLAYDVPNDRLLTSSAATGRLVAFRPDTTAAEPLGFIDPGAYGFAVDPSGTRLVAAGPWGLRGYALDTSKDTLPVLWTQEADVRGVALVGDAGRLFALARDGSWMTADSAGAPLRNVGALEPGDEEADTEQLHNVLALATSPLTPTVFAAGTRLMAISPDQATFEVERFRRGYRDEASPDYVRYVEPMRRIRSELDITYLYTQNLVPGDSIQYIVDSTPMGDDHSPIGTREALETEADIRGLADLMDRGAVYSSKIEDSEDWGLLKSAFAPIFSPRGDPVGMVGTDISVGTIQDRTQIALAKVGLVTVVILFLGGLGSVAISLRLTGPLAAVQEGASRVAAGRAGNPIEPPRLRDLAALTTSFNEMTQTLTSSVNELREETRRVEAMRTRRHLVHELGARKTADGALPPGVVTPWWGERADERAPADVVVVGSEERPLSVLHVRPDRNDPLTVLAEGEEFALLVRRITASGAIDPASVARKLERFWDPARGGFLVIDAAEGAVTASDTASVHGVLRTPEGQETPVALGTGATYVVPAGGELGVFSGPVGARGAERAEPLVRVRGVPA